MLNNLQLILEKNQFVKNIIKAIYVPTIGKYKKYQNNKNFLKYGERALQKVDEVFTELNIQYWLEYGTLLGAIRNNSFLKHDDDIDIGVFLHDYTPKIDEIFKKYGFKKTREFLIDNGAYGREQSFEIYGVNVDIFYFTKKSSNKAYCHIFLPLPGKSRIKTIQEKGGLIPREELSTIEDIIYIDFLNKKYPAPFPTKKHLQDEYGEYWHIEDKSWDMQTFKNPNWKILENKVGVRKIYD